MDAASHGGEQLRIAVAERSARATWRSPALAGRLWGSPRQAGRSRSLPGMPGRSQDFNWISQDFLGFWDFARISLGFTRISEGS